MLWRESAKYILSSKGSTGSWCTTGCVDSHPSSAALLPPGCTQVTHSLLPFLPLQMFKVRQIINFLCAGDATWTAPGTLPSLWPLSRYFLYLLSCLSDCYSRIMFSCVYFYSEQSVWRNYRWSFSVFTFVIILLKYTYLSLYFIDFARSSLL